MSTKTLSSWAIPGIKPELMPKIKRKTDADIIIEAVCSYFGLHKADILARCRKREIVYARNMVSYFLYYDAHMTLNGIAQKLSPALTDHTTALHGRDKIKEQLTLKLPAGIISQTEKDVNQIQNLFTQHNN